MGIFDFFKDKGKDGNVNGIPNSETTLDGVKYDSHSGIAESEALLASLSENINTASLELTKDLLNIFSVEEIIYAEIAETGAMGNAGGIRIFIIKEEKLVTYISSYHSDKYIYFAVADLLGCHYIRNNKNNNIRVDKIIFDYYPGGMGNHVYVNKNITLKIEQGYFIFNKNKKVYHILSSVYGVFRNVAVQMQRSTW